MVWAVRPVAEVVCTNNVVSGYYFNAAESTNAGTNATTTVCPPGTAGYATRRVGTV